MLAIIGFVSIFVLVFGGYYMSGGKFAVILEALPHEFPMIGGAACGAFMVANSGIVVKHTMGDLGRVFKGPKWHKNDYLELLCLLSNVLKVLKSKGALALESHLDNYKESDIFNKYPRVIADHFAISFICDSLRLLTMGFDNPYHNEDNMVGLLEKHHHESLEPAHALQGMAEGLPAIGIVAAVLGVIKTMASVTEPPAVLGGMIGGALVGTFMGVFLSYCILSPMASKITSSYNEDAHFYETIRTVLISSLQGSSPQVSVEIGRSKIPGHFHVTFAELEAKLSS